MKIAVLTRTLNEEKLIGLHCKSYDWADKLIIADGGSTDHTLEIARTFPNVEVHIFNEWVEQKGIRRNHEAKHLNYLVDLGIQGGYDWLVMEDADHALSPALYRNALRIFEEAADYTMIFGHRVYIWGTKKWFPGLTGGSLSSGREWMGFWAWRPIVNIRWREDLGGFHTAMTQDDFSAEPKLYLYVPFVLLHYFCLDQATVDRKLRLYRDSGQYPEMQSWIKTCGPLEELPSWCLPTYYPEWETFQTDLS